MAFALLPSESYLITNGETDLVTFSVATTIKSVRLTNTSASTVAGVILYFRYDGVAGNAVARVIEVDLAAKQSVVLDGGPWNFGAGGKISGIAGTTNVVNLHFTPATI